MAEFQTPTEAFQWARVKDLEAALKDAIELADEGWAYAMPYFLEKWDYAGQRAKLAAVLEEST